MSFDVNNNGMFTKAVLAPWLRIMTVKEASYDDRTQLGTDAYHSPPHHAA
jgi:hypothetical protein